MAIPDKLTSDQEISLEKARELKRILPKWLDGDGECPCPKHTKEESKQCSM